MFCAAWMNYITDVLSIYARADCHNELWWRVDDGLIRFFAICSDWFAWATADLEEITPDDLALLRQTADDLAAIDEGYHLSTLYASRKRQMRPMRQVYTDANAISPAAAQLFDAAGPPRE